MSEISSPVNPVAYRQPVPTVALTIVITLLFGLFGLIPAATGSSKARQAGLPTAKYWVAFTVTFVVMFLLMALIIVNTI